VKKEFKLCKADLGHSSLPPGKLSFHLSGGMQFFPPQVTLGKSGIFAKKRRGDSSSPGKSRARVILKGKTC